MTAGQQLVVGVVMVTVFLGIAWLMLSGGTGSPVSSRGQHRDDGLPRWLLSEMGEFIIPAHVVKEMARPAFEAIRRAAVYEQWRERRAIESPIFARLAAEMGLSQALGVAA